LNERHPSRLKPYLGVLFVLLIAGVFGFLIFRQREQFRDIDWHINPAWLALHILCLAGMFFTLIFSWKQLLRFHQVPQTLRQVLYGWCVPNLGKYIPGKVMMLAGRVLLAKQFGIRPAVSSTCLLLEQLFCAFATLPFFAIYLLHTQLVPRGVIYPTVGIIIPVIILIVINPNLLINTLNFLLAKIKRSPVDVTLSRTQLTSLLGFYLLGWCFYGASGVVIFQAFGFAAPSSLLATASAFVVAWFIGFISLLSPGGLGIREGILVLFLSAEYSSAEAIAIALLARITWSAMELGLVLVGYALKPPPSSSPPS
jgi:glycosyltransferase 2 family protein